MSSNLLKKPLPNTIVYSNVKLYYIFWCLFYLCLTYIKKTITPILFTCRVTNNDYIPPSEIKKLNTFYSSLENSLLVNVKIEKLNLRLSINSLFCTLLSVEIKNFIKTYDYNYFVFAIFFLLNADFVSIQI